MTAPDPADRPCCADRDRFTARAAKPDEKHGGTRGSSRLPGTAGRSVRTRWSIASALLIALVGCGGGDDDGRPEEPYALAGRACLRELAARDGIAVPWALSPARGCPVETPLRAARTGEVRFVPPLETSCALLVALADWERELARLARLHLREDLAELHHSGSYACRPMTGRGGRLSLHGRARAIDVRGFRTSRGRTLDVRRDWARGGAEGRFLRAAAKAACDVFSVVLTPRTDRAHADHLHLDIGPWRKCDI